MGLIEVQARRTYARRWRQANPEKARSYARKYEYGVTEEQWSLMIEDGCGICVSRSLLVPDHDHKSRVVRGALCKKCNTALGQFNDDPERLKKALLWLERGSCR